MCCKRAQKPIARPRWILVLQRGLVVAVVLLSGIGRAAPVNPIPMKRIYNESLPALQNEALLTETFHSKKQGDIANHPFLDITQYKEIRRAGVDVVQRYPNHIVVTPGRSMTALTAFLQNLSPHVATNLPLSGLRKHTPTAEQMDAHLDKYLAPAIGKFPGQPLVIVDRSSRGGSINKTQQMLAGWLQRRGDNRRVDVLSFDRHPELKLPRYDIKNITSFETPQLFEEFSQHNHFIVGVDRNAGNRGKYKTLRKAMRQRMQRDQTLHRQLEQLGRFSKRRK